MRLLLLNLIKRCLYELTDQIVTWTHDDDHKGDDDEDHPQVGVIRKPDDVTGVKGRHVRKDLPVAADPIEARRAPLIQKAENQKHEIPLAGMRSVLNKSLIILKNGANRFIHLFPKALFFVFDSQG